jgi:hypothetical protein
MKEARIALPKLGFIAATRALLGVGIGLLLSEKIARDRRRVVGIALAAFGALSTIPIAINVAKRVRAERPNGQPSAFQTEGLAAD